MIEEKSKIRPFTTRFPFSAAVCDSHRFLHRSVVSDCSKSLQSARVRFSCEWNSSLSAEDSRPFSTRRFTTTSKTVSHFPFPHISLCSDSLLARTVHRFSLVISSEPLIPFSYFSVHSKERFIDS